MYGCIYQQFDAVFLGIQHLVEEYLLHVVLDFLIWQHIHVDYFLQLIFHHIVVQYFLHHQPLHQRLIANLDLIVGILHPGDHQTHSAPQHTHHPVPSKHMISIGSPEDLVGGWEHILGPGVLVVPAMQEVPQGVGAFGIVFEQELVGFG